MGRLMTSSILFLILWWVGSALLDRLGPEHTRLLASYTRGERM